MRKVARASLGPAHLTYTSDMNSPVNSAPWGDCLKALSKSEETKNAAPFGDTSKGTHVEAEMGKTGSTFTSHDSGCLRVLRGHQLPKDQRMLLTLERTPPPVQTLSARWRGITYMMCPLPIMETTNMK